MYRIYSDYLKTKYGEKVYKLPVNLSISCPNRSHGKGGCTFCADVGTGFEAMSSQISVAEQLEKTKDKIAARYKAQKFIAYFQNYTNTYMSLERFQSYILEAANVSDIVEISISTRPDCIKKEYLDFLSEDGRRARHQHGGGRQDQQGALCHPQGARRGGRREGFPQSFQPVDRQAARTYR